MIKEINHPLIKEKLSRMRNADVDTRDFRSNLFELSQLMCYEVTKDYQVTPFPIKTPICDTNGHKLNEHIVLVPILRAGLGMVDGFKTMIPSASIGHLGLYRNEEMLEPIQYYCKMPKNIKGSNVIILDPMLATGHSAIKAVEIIKQFEPKSIKFVSVLSAPEGIKLLTDSHPDIELFTSSVDEKLNDKGYIVPGLGDAGDRIFGTK